MSDLDAGSEVVQFALAMPLLLLVVFSVVQVGGMVLAVNQVSSDIVRACRQLDAAGLQRAADKEAFVKEGIVGKATQLREENLSVENVSVETSIVRVEGLTEAGGMVDQRTSATAFSYDVRYNVPSILALPGLEGRVLARHVNCDYVDGRVIEVSLGAAL